MSAVTEAQLLRIYPNASQRAGVVIFGDRP